MTDDALRLRLPRSSERKRFSADRFALLPPVVAAFIRLHHATCKFTILGAQYEVDALRSGKPPIFTAWHFAFPALIYYFRDRNGMLMVSRSRDGEWVARVLRSLGYHSARGSSGKGGGMALRQLIGHMRKGYSAGFIADGSQGPALVAQEGILILARHTQCPLVPVSMAAKPCWRFRSWDRTLLAKPFSQVVLAFGHPLHVRKDCTPAELEVLKRHLETTLNSLTADAEGWLAYSHSQ
ncbi:MAG: lysophospholipid acyltransferase family protein [Deltaproteobacteria bacterium]|nr:lysophospholipid acyltransferase family protein [Deltaproteobacteria bacterium]